MAFLTDFNENILDIVPSFLANSQRWLLWSAEPNGKNPKPRKVPRYANSYAMRSGKLGSNEDISNLTILSKAHEKALTKKCGIGFAFIKEDGLVGIDLDNCVNENGEISEKAQKIAQMANSYTEFSPSGKGIHIIVKGATIAGKCSQIEVYPHDRFFCFTGNCLDEFSREINEPSAEFFIKLHKSIEITKKKDRPELPKTASNIPQKYEPSDSKDKALHALNYIPASISNDDWIRVGMALKTEFGENEGFDIFNEWSKGCSDKYDPNNILTRWRSFRGGGTTIATVFHMAKEYGYQAPKRQIAYRSENENIKIESESNIIIESNANIESEDSRDIVNDTNTEIDHYLENDNFGDWPEIIIKSGKPKNTIENCKALLNHYGVTPRYNIIKKSVEIALPGESFTIDNAQNVTISHLRSIANRNSFPVSELEGYIKAIAEKNVYNPIAQWIKSMPWDGVDRLKDLLGTIKSDNNELKELLITKWMVSAVAAAFKAPPFSAHGILVFQGAQGQGKTSWVANLMPNMLSSQYIKTGVTGFDPADKDQVIGVVTNWIVELGELGSSLRKDVDKIKAFCTNSYDRVRRPYDRMESEYSRKTVFFASVNESNFLKDDTGNRRFWIINTTEINYNHGLDMQQIWAQVLYLYNSGYASYLTMDEQKTLAESNEEFMEHDPIDEAIGETFDWNSHVSNWRYLTTLEVLKEIKILQPNRMQATTVARILNRKDIKKYRTHGMRKFHMPPIKQKDFFDNSDLPY